ncbi:magnesium transporter CorA [Pontibacter sp. KCTC 32443]|uniref:magnesium transporter CorA family protein n=1 Tax=Pontibacter TaxID=323449 RepID=UPI00164E94BA|nr:MULTISPECIES: CorA family divalent cation transporter [Pontibacter]MBC5774707.1 magnesium transporter CorA [Pontibacter sp. KCTC 32443]
MQQTFYSSQDNSWEWIDVENPSADELQELAQKYGLHPSSVRDCLQPEHLPKFEIANDIIFIISRVYDHKAHLEADTIQELTNKLAVFFHDKFIITIHRHPLDFIPEIKEKYIDTGSIKFPKALLTRIVRAAFRTFEEPALKLANDLDYYETKTFLQVKPNSLTKGLYHLKRKVSVSKRVLQLSEVILYNLRLQHLPSTEMQDLHDLYVHMVTLYEELNDSTNNLVNTYISLSSQKTNEVMRVLTIFSVFFMPLTFIVGIYGMNFEFMPELETKYGYPMVIVSMLLITMVIYFWFKRKGWL